MDNFKFNTVEEAIEAIKKRQNGFWLRTTKTAKMKATLLWQRSSAPATM